MANVEGKANYMDCSCPECRTHIASELADQPTLEDLAAIRQASMELEGQEVSLIVNGAALAAGVPLAESPILTSLNNEVVKLHVVFSVQ